MPLPLSLIPLGLTALGIGAVGTQQALQNLSPEQRLELLKNAGQLATGTKGIESIVSALRDTPSGTFSAPDLDEIEELNRKMREFDKKITLPSEDLPKILSTPEPEGLPSIISSPIPPEEKVSVDDVGFTPTPALRLEDMIMTAKNPEDLFKDERFQEVLKMAKGDPNIDYREEDKKRGDYIMEAPQGNTFWTTAGFPGDKMNPAKSVIIYVKPGDYLNLAKKKEGGYNEASFELYKNTNVGISVPKLLMNEDENGVFSVTGHEGRHRAKYFEGLDPDKPIPVQVQLTNKGSDEYVDYTKGYYTHGQSVLNAGKKLEELGFAMNENGKSTKFKVFGYQGDGQKVGEIFEAPKSKYTLPEKSVNDFFEVAGQYETIDGSIEDYEYAYHGGVGDLGNNRAAISIQQTEAYPDYRMWIEEQAQNFLGDEFTGFRIANTKEVMSLLNNQKKNKIKSYTLNPRQAIGFGYMANEAFMDPITTYPRGDLVIIESPIKSESLVMRGRPEEAEVVTDTTGVSIKNSRIYNPYTGEVIYEPTKGPLVGKEPYQFERLLKTETKKSSFLDELKDKFTKKEKTSIGSLMDKPLYED